MSQYSLCVRLIKYTLIVLNVIFVIFGLALLGVGIYIKVDKRFDVAFAGWISDQIKGAAGFDHVGTIMIISGCFIVLFAMLGFCGE